MGLRSWASPRSSLLRRAAHAALGQTLVLVRIGLDAMRGGGGG